MAQNESRYAVLRDLIYPKEYFGGVSNSTTIKGWSPNNLRRIFISKVRVYVQWYMVGDNKKLGGINPFLSNYTGQVINSGALRYKDFASANVAVENDVNYELKPLLDLVFKTGDDGYKLANIEEIIFINESQNEYLSHDGMNYNAYDLKKYTRYIGITSLEVSSEKEFLSLIVENDNKPVCEWKNANLKYPFIRDNNKCLIDDKLTFYSGINTHAPGENKVDSSGVTYEIDVAIRKKLEKLRDDYAELLDKEKNENERETIDKQIYIKKLNICRKMLVSTKVNVNYGQYFSKIMDIVNKDSAYIVGDNKLVDSFLRVYFQKTVGDMFEEHRNKKYVTDTIFRILDKDAESTASFYNNIYEISNKMGVELTTNSDKLTENIKILQLYIDAMILLKTMIKHKAFDVKFGVYGELHSILLSFLSFINNKNLSEKIGVSKDILLNSKNNIGDIALTDYNGLFKYESKNGAAFIYGFYRYLKNIQTKQVSRYKDIFDEVLDNNKEKVDSIKIRDIMRKKMNVDHIDDLDIEQQEIFEALCLYATYYILLVKYVKRDALKWVNIANIKSQGIQLKHYLVISQVAQEYIGDDDVSEIINAFSERINVEEDNNDKFSNKGEIHNMYEEIKNIGGIINGE